MTKYIRLYEEYTDFTEKGSSLRGWPDLRDAMTLRLPYMIIDFKTEESKKDCESSDIKEEDYVTQSYFLKQDGKTKEYPSVFIFLDSSDPINKIKRLESRFDIARIIYGEFGKKQPSMSLNGQTSDFGSDIKTGSGPDDMENDDYYKYNSSYYKFLN